jgi:hypothetical protein
MNGFFASLCAIVVSFSLAIIPAKACTGTAVDASAKVRELQSVLMVSALQCRHVEGLDMLSGYNQFIANQRSTLQRHNGQLRAYFVQASGRAGLSAFDQYATRLANLYASTAQQQGFCDTMAQLMQAASAVSPDALPQFAMAALPESPICLKD